MEVQHQSTEVCRELWEEEGSKAQSPLTEKISSYMTFTFQITDNFSPGLQRAELPGKLLYVMTDEAARGQK